MVAWRSLLLAKSLINSWTKPRLPWIFNLVGGQAINFWAEAYLTNDPILQDLAPFTSKDIDFLGSRPLVVQIAKYLGVEPTLPDTFDNSGQSGVIVIEDSRAPDGKILIDFLPGLYGFNNHKQKQTDFDADKIRLKVEIPLPSGRFYPLSVIHPIICLESRVHNIFGFPKYQQNETYDQLRASIRSLHGYVDGLFTHKPLEEAVKSAGQLNARLLDLAKNYKTRVKRVIELSGVNPLDAFLLRQEFSAEFFTKQIPQVKRKLNALGIPIPAHFPP